MGFLVHGGIWGCGERLVSIVIFVWFCVVLAGNTLPPPPALPLPLPCACLHHAFMHMAFVHTCTLGHQDLCASGETRMQLEGRPLAALQHDPYQNGGLCKGLWE